MCVYLCIHNKYAQYTDKLFKHKLILDAINYNYSFDSTNI